MRGKLGADFGAGLPRKKKFGADAPNERERERRGAGDPKADCGGREREREGGR